MLLVGQRGTGVGCQGPGVQHLLLGNSLVPPDRQIDKSDHENLPAQEPELLFLQRADLRFVHVAAQELVQRAVAGVGGNGDHLLPVSVPLADQVGDAFQHRVQVPAPGLVLLLRGNHLGDCPDRRVSDFEITIAPVQGSRADKRHQQQRPQGLQGKADAKRGRIDVEPVIQVTVDQAPDFDGILGILLFSERIDFLGAVADLDQPEEIPKAFRPAFQRGQFHQDHRDSPGAAVRVPAGIGVRVDQELPVQHHVGDTGEAKQGYAAGHFDPGRNRQGMDGAVHRDDPARGKKARVPLKPEQNRVHFQVARGRLHPAEFGLGAIEQQGIRRLFFDTDGLIHASQDFR